MMVPGPSSGLSDWFYVFVMNWPNMAPFSTIPVPPGIVFHGGSDFDGPRAWKSSLSKKGAASKKGATSKKAPPRKKVPPRKKAPPRKRRWRVWGAEPPTKTKLKKLGQL